MVNEKTAKEMLNSELIEQLNEIHDITYFLAEIEDQIDVAQFLGLLEEIIQVKLDKGDFTKK